MFWTVKVFPEIRKEMLQTKHRKKPEMDGDVCLCFDKS